MNKLILLIMLSLSGTVFGQPPEKQNEVASVTQPHSVLPVDGIVPYLPEDSANSPETVKLSKSISFTPSVYFFFRPEGTSNYKQAGLPLDTSSLNFFLRGDFGGKISLPKNIDMVFNFQSNGTYTSTIGPLDKNLTFYEGYASISGKKFSFRFGRMNLGKYGTEILVGDDDFTIGRSFEALRLRFQTRRLTSDLMWVQMYQSITDSTGQVWNHPVFFSNFNTVRISDALNLDINIPSLVDQHQNGYHTYTLMPDVRVYGRTSNIKYSAEFISQQGWATGVYDESLEGTVNAYATEWSAGYFSRNNKFSVDASFYQASGDANTADGNLTSYNVLWQNEHRRFGYIDAFKGSNVQAVTLHMDVNVARSLNVGVHGVYANVLELKDKSTGIASITSLSSIATSDKFIGSGGDFYINYFISHHLNIQLATALFSPGEYFTAVNGIKQNMFRLYGVGVLKF